MSTQPVPQFEASERLSEAGELCLPQVSLPQYSSSLILGIWALVTAPMALLGFVVAPLLAPHVDLHRGLLHWALMVVGMMWQCLVSLWLLHREAPLRWREIRQRIWAQTPRDPKTGHLRRRLWWWVVPAIAVNAFGGWVVGPLDRLWSDLIGVSEPGWAQLQQLADEQFAGQWWILGLALVSVAFNYLLGEELLFRGVLLPRMAGTFGRWDWVANTVLFGLYHVHKIWFWPSMLFSSFGIAWVAKRFRSFWMAVAVHGVEGFFVFLVLAVVAGWMP